MSKKTGPHLKRKLEDDENKHTLRKPKIICREDNSLKAYEPQWTDNELLAEQQNLSLDVAHNIIKLFDEGNTIPFIARYRRDVTNNMSPEILREVKETYEEISSLKNKMATIMKKLEQSSILTDELKRTVTCSRSIEELEYVYAPYKPEGNRRTLAEKAKKIGLEEPALHILQNTKQVNLNNYVVQEQKELSDVANIKKGIVHIIASVISADTEVLTALRDLRKTAHFIIKTKKAVSKQNATLKGKQNQDNGLKFDAYMDFEIPIKYIKPHQVLAINRGESLKALTVNIIVPENIFHSFERLCMKKWFHVGQKSQMREEVLRESIEDAYKRLVQPLLIREVRSELKQKAERASCEVFSTNLKHLLLTAPMKGKAVLGVDPGFSNGCKLALISAVGNLLCSDVIYPHKGSNRQMTGEKTLRDMLLKYNCELIALGNGTACRQTEEWLTSLIQSKAFNHLDVKYTIVREEGASIYSCSAQAKKEFDTLDPNIISAVSLARRLQEPLAEFIKVEPKHLGVGMYQHDIKKKYLEEALNDVISECVSFVGVDLNTASQCLLQHVAGLSEKRAQHVIEYRNKNGAFHCRKQLLEVSGIGKRIFQQCAGFLRVGPLEVDHESHFYTQPATTKLDCTYIHPESYDVASKLMKKLKLEPSDIGNENFINDIKPQISNLNVTTLGEEFKSDVQTVQLILDALSKPLNYDLRSDCSSKPVFKKNLTSIKDISVGTVLTGQVTNVTHFGCFVDVGVGVNGLIHVSKYKGIPLQLGNKVEVKVINVETDRNRIGLETVKLL